MGEMGTGRPPIGAILAIVGGALLGIGSFLAWAEVSGGGTSVTAKGIDGSDGYITLGAGVVALIVGVLMLRQTGRALAVLAIVAGLIGGGVAVYDAITARDSVLDAAAEELAPTVGVPSDLVRDLLDEAIDAGQLSISLSIGIYAVIAGGVLALLGGIVAMRGSGSPLGSGDAAAIGHAPAPAPALTSFGTDPADAPPAPAPPATSPPSPDEDGP